MFLYKSNVEHTVDDKEAFIKVVVENYKSHQLIKENLDKKMLEIESSDEKYDQFSQTRDQPFVDEYLEYVKNFTLGGMQSLNF